ncbi:opioid-binding protein/cell adhesion molecule homolog [Mercenaria mercenaria]|uniref:opioid-binding protein/cell adhesion molecule homolog n=1 Tax=Mercenaria mercenaria TaxID=6596 RepID=UPI00234EE57D|nr:opioid-binding protein/cell adhesion molecule homolog [Mercenaria mercenaria]
MRIFILLLVRYTCAFQAGALVEEEPKMPLFDKTTLNITAVAGETAILPCSVERKGDEHKIIWLNPRKTLISREDSRFIDDSRISVERPKVRDWNLMIREVRYNDSGEYMCQINTKPHVEIKRINLFVKVPPEILEYWTSTEIEVIEGTTVDLMCNATGVPIPVVTWYKQSNLLKGADQNDGGEESTLIGEVLILHNISRYCDGIYECNAENGVLPMATRKFEVTVLFPPEVDVPTKRIGQSIGKETILQCKVSASPQESIVWTKNGSALPQKYKYWTQLYDEGHHEKTLNLNIIDIDKDDFGYYTCEASNTLGRDSETMILYEYKIITQPRPRITTPPWRPSPRTSQDYDPNIITPHYYPGSRGQVGSVYYNYNSVAVSSWTNCDGVLIVTFVFVCFINQFSMG